ncbi:MAG: DUF1294 domain-containing protein [Sulfurimonas sp.]|nr:DUF1294 domain-containing protein [Sulfurimonas sp.]
MIHFSFSLSYIQIYIITISIISFGIYSFDKAQALSNNRNISRISEFHLLLSSFLGGSFGSLAAMFLFRHKIKKLSFLTKFTLVCIVQLALVFVYLRKDSLL